MPTSFVAVGAGAVAFAAAIQARQHVDDHPALAGAIFGVPEGLAGRRTIFEEALK